MRTTVRARACRKFSNEYLCTYSVRLWQVPTSRCPDEARQHEGHAHEHVRRAEKARDETQHRRHQQWKHAVAQDAHALEERAARGRPGGGGGGGAEGRALYA